MNVHLSIILFWCLNAYLRPSLGMDRTSLVALDQCSVNISHVIQDPRQNIRQCDPPDRLPQEQQVAHHLGRVRPQTGQPRQEGPEMMESWSWDGRIVNCSLNFVLRVRLLSDIR